MKKVLKFVFLILPVGLWVCLWGYCTIRKTLVRRQIHEADGLCWGMGEKQLTIQVDQSVEGESTQYRVIAKRPDGLVAHRTEFRTDSDLWGGGFVAAVQADEDPDLEILAWGTQEGSLLLDYVDGQVSEIPNDEVSSPIQELGSTWMDAGFRSHAAALALLIPLGFYYGFVAVVWGLIRGAKRLLRRGDRARSLSD
jgi:hypothetical protein